MSPASRTKRKPKFRVGDEVTFQYGVYRLKGTIIEDRGNIGAEGRRLVAIRVPRTDLEDMIIELTVDKLQAA